ncbi:protocadherin beta-15-like isoform X1 [Anas platyrhynchos]|uniref:protocadherin beta-15-like isoform X1 n=1 Tax=Anas platyrhynchos TaxID=8839 RepID=UPI003AF30CB7
MIIHGFSSMLLESSHSPFSHCLFLYELCWSMVLTIALKKDCHDRQNMFLERWWYGTEHLEKLTLLCAAVIRCITATQDTLSCKGDMGRTPQHRRLCKGASRRPGARPVPEQSRRRPQGGARGQGGGERLRAGRRPSPAQRSAAQPGGGGERSSAPSSAAAAAGPGVPRCGPPAELGERERGRPRGRAPALGAALLPGAASRGGLRQTEGVRRPAMASARQVLCLCALLCVPRVRCEPIRYSVAEEGESGSVVANVAEDAGLTPAQLSARRARIASADGRQHFRLERATGRLVLAERLDREEMCGRSLTCTLAFELLLENPLQFFRVEVAVEDVNDHSPVFPEERVTFQIPETSDPGSRFPVEVAQDLDIGSNSIQAYTIAPGNDYFSVSPRIKGNSDIYVELVLEKPLDREEQPELLFSLIATDGGSPPRSGTTQIHIIVLDANDNAPIFTQEVYVVQVLENAPAGFVVLRVIATDPDVGLNGDISYGFSQAINVSHFPFTIGAISGEIRVTKPLDFESKEKHELRVRATDGGGLSALCKVLVEVVDVNDNAPEVVISSFSNPLPENTEPGTVVAVFAVRDRDSGVNGEISCALEDQLSFSLRPAYKNYYELVTVTTLDREETAQYLVVITAEDAGSPPLTTTQTLTVDISDVNDNAPVFNQTLYTMYVQENNIPGVLVGAVSAADSDAGPNAKVTYSLMPVYPAERDPCSCISVNSENGHVFVLRPLDYEQVRQLEVLVSATDAGSPPLNTNVTVRLLVVDENDNAPLVLHPAQDSSPPSSELVPASAEMGDLVTKVVAVDADSGQNSWLSFHLLRATDPGLFAVGSQNGEVHLRRPVTERDAVKQKLEVLVRDNGRPPLSATAALNVLLLNGLSQEHLPQQELAVQDEDSSLTIYLIVSLVFVSLLFLTSVAAFVACKVCKRKELKGGHMLYSTGNLQSSLAAGAAAGTLPHAYCYEINLTTGSGNSEFKFLKPILPSVPPQHSGTGRGVGDTEDFLPIQNSMGDAALDISGTPSVGHFNGLPFN